MMQTIPVGKEGKQEEEEEEEEEEGEEEIHLVWVVTYVEAID